MKPMRAWAWIAVWLPMAANALAAGALPGDGPDCERLLQPAQRWVQVVHPDDATRGVFAVDDGRLLPLRRASAAAPWQPAEDWPDADCRLRELPPPGPAPAWPPALSRLLVDAVTLAEPYEAAAARGGGLAQRAGHWQRAAQGLAAAGETAAADPLAATAIERVRVLALLAALDAGRVDLSTDVLLERWRGRVARLGPTAFASVEALAEAVRAMEVVERQAAALEILQAELPALRESLGAQRRQVLRLEALRVRLVGTLQGTARALPAARALWSDAQAVLAPAEPLRLDIELLLGRTLLGAGQRAAASAQLEALAARLGPLPSRRAALVQDRLATAYLGTGRLSEGLLASQRSYLWTADLVAPDHPDALRAANNHADNLRQLGDVEAALPFARLAFEGYRRLYGDGHRATLISARNLSLQLGELKQPEESLRLVVPQVDAAEARLGADDPQVLNTRIHVVELLGLVGRHREAQAAGEAVLGPTERRFGRDGELTLVAQVLLAGAAAGAGDLARARATLDLALERIAGIDDQRRALALLAVAAGVAEGLGDPARHEDLLARFVELADRADRSGLSEDTASWVQLFRAAPHLRWTVMKAERGEVDAAFDLSERFKGRVLLATLGQVAGDASPALPEAVRDGLAQARRRIRAAEAEAAAATDPATKVELGARRESAAQDYLALRERARREHPRFGALSDAPVLGSADVPRVLRPAVCMLSFVTAETHAGVFVLAPGQRILWRSLPAPPVLDALVQRVRDAWGAPSSDAADGADEASAALARWLAPAFQACPARTRKLVLSPDGALALLPFEPLVIGGRRLVDRFEIGYVQSFSVLALLQQRPAPRPGHALLGVGAPTFDLDGRTAAAAPALPLQALRSAAQTAAVATLSSDPQAARRAFDAMGTRWSPLPGAARELRSVGRMFERRRVLVGDQASEEALAALDRSGELAGYRYLLFSTHGFLSYTHPALSAIVLRQPGSAQFDGYLTAAEWPLYRLDSELIVLSACETGVGPVRAGSGVMGLPLALMMAGNRHAVVSLWSVPDGSTSELVTRLFRHLRGGATPAAALAAAKRELLRLPRYARPQDWAGFVVYGAP